MPTDDVRKLTEAKALAALAHPTRSRLLDILTVDGPGTASALAERTEQAVGSISHHMKVLADAGLVQEAPELARDRRERWWRITPGRVSWSRTQVAHDLASARTAVAAEKFVLATQVERASEWLEVAQNVDEWDEAAFATQGWLHLTSDELRQVNQEVLDIIDRWRHRDVPDDGRERETIFLFARGFPAQP
ncbi:ArsR/SmtB family transcription factor [Promicromonospora vindobonensis]|uniref:ArsR/SmtB family transcription factor n=1 Tax=Promicromonospora vindobonensis TaxID=195748 RepID=A0ABW5VUS1_9MICO